MENFCDFQHFLGRQGIAGFLNKGKEKLLSFFAPKYRGLCLLTPETNLTFRVGEENSAVQMNGNALFLQDLFQPVQVGVYLLYGAVEISGPCCTAGAYLYPIPVFVFRVCKDLPFHMLAFYDANAGIGAITTYRNIKGGKKMMRIIWDRPQYRKDYLCDYFMSDLPGGHVIAYEAETSFYRVNSNNIKSK